MALSSLLLPSSSSASTATDTADRRKRKKKPPPSPLPQSAPMRTPPSPALSASRRAASKKSPAAAASKIVAAKSDHRLRHHSKKSATPGKPVKPASSSSWEQLKSLLSCRSATAASRVHDPAALTSTGGAGAWSSSLCSMRDVAVDGASSAASVDHRDTAPLNRSSRRHHRAGAGAGASSSSTGGHPSSLRGLSGCYECRAINVEPVSRRYPRPRELCPCSQCGEVFTKADSLEQHQAIRHAVSELGPEDSGRNIVEIIFKSSWQKRDRPICQVDRILKVHNRPRTVARFEAYRDAVRARCRAATPSSSSGAGEGTASRAAADGNELLRFHPAGLACALGAAGSASLCSSAAAADDAEEGAKACGVCAAIRHGFAPWAGAHPLGVRTTASSGRAHDCGAAQAGWRAMLVCRVIAGQVRREQDGGGGGEQEGPFDSVAGEVDAASSAYGTLEELFVANPRAILPCFVVIYRVEAAQ